MILNIFFICNDQLFMLLILFTNHISYSDLLQITDLTEFLIEHCEILGENIPNLLDIDEGTLS